MEHETPQQADPVASDPAASAPSAQVPLVASRSAGAPVPPWQVLLVEPDDTSGRQALAALAGLSHAGRPLVATRADSVAQARALLSQTPPGHFSVIVITLEPADVAEGLALVADLQHPPESPAPHLILSLADPALPAAWALLEAGAVADCRDRRDLSGPYLRSVIVAALRGSRQHQRSEDARQSLHRALNAIGGLFDPRELGQFFPTLLNRLEGLFDQPQPHALLCLREDANDGWESPLVVRAGRGRYLGWVGQPVEQLGEPALAQVVDEALASPAVVQGPQHWAFALNGQRGDTAVVCIAGQLPGGADSCPVLGIFRTKAASALDNLLLVQELNRVQHAAVHALALVTGFRDHDTDGHLERIERLACEIASALKAAGHYGDQIDERFLRQIGPAAILHDVGMFIVPDDILTSTEALVEEDFRVIARHPLLGHQILSTAAKPLRRRNILWLAAEIARYHHERWDGTGYPEGVRGAAIPLAARIVGVADTFDAMISERVHRRAIPVDQALASISAQAGRAFEPPVVVALVTVVRRLQTAEPGWFPDGAVSSSRHGGGGLRGLVRRLFGKSAFAP